MAKPPNTLKVRADSAETLAYVSGLMQDAIIAPKDIDFDPSGRRFALAANRYRWEAEADGRGLFRMRPRPTRIRSFLRFDFVDSVQTRQFERGAPTPLSLLAITAQDSDEALKINLSFAGGSDIALTCESVDVTLDDVGLPWVAQNTPKHHQ